MVLSIGTNFPTTILKWCVTLGIIILSRYALLNTYHNVLISVKHNGDYLDISNKYYYLCYVNKSITFKTTVIMKVHIYLYRKGSLEVDEYIKDFKTQRSLNTYLSKMENKSCYDSVEWYFER